MERRAGIRMAAATPEAGDAGPQGWRSLAAVAAGAAVLAVLVGEVLRGAIPLAVVALLAAALAAGIAAVIGGFRPGVRRDDLWTGIEAGEQRELNFVLTAAERLGSTLERDQILARAVELAGQGPAATGEARWTWVGYQPVTQGWLAVSAAEAQPPFEYAIEENQAAAAAIRTGRAAIVRGDHLRGRVLEWYRALGLQVLVMVAVRAGDRTVGLLAAGRTDSVAVDRGPLRLLEVTARLTGLAIGNAEHLAREVDHADRMRALEKAKGDLLNLVSHELRGPLTVTRGYVSMLEDGSFGPMPESASGVFGIVSDKLTEMEALVQQILEASRVDEQRLVIRREPIDLRSSIAGAVRAVEHLVTPRHDLRVEMGTVPVVVAGDAQRLTTIVANMLSNALKYSPEGGAVTCRLAAEGATARVEVTDDGIGIPPAQQEALFTRFGRVVTSETSSIPGTGLGLYLARELARLHGGDITVRSEPDRGSVFTLTLPLAP